MAKQTDLNPLALSPARVANKLGLAPRTVREMIYNKQIPAIQVGRRWLIPVKALENWLDEQVKA
jgi:excisionase family DNA binding protein